MEEFVPWVIAHTESHITKDYDLPTVYNNFKTKEILFGEVNATEPKCDQVFVTFIYKNVVSTIVYLLHKLHCHWVHMSKL